MTSSYIPILVKGVVAFAKARKVLPAFEVNH
jgi:hypothetical protein